MAKPYTGPDDEYCPRWQKLCKRVCPTCKFQKHIIGINPQTGAQFDVWDCVETMLPELIIENSKLQNETGAAVNDLRNVTVGLSREASGVMAQHIEETLARAVNGSLGASERPLAIEKREDA